MASDIPRRLWLWGMAGLLLVAGLAGYWYIDSQASQSDADRLLRLRDAPLPATSPSLTLDWPQWRGPERNGISSETGLLTVWPTAGPPILWKAPAGLGFSSLAIAAGRVFSLVQEGDEEAAVCWDTETGRELWRFRYPCLLMLDHGNGPRSSPAVDGDRVYFLGAAGAFHCLGVADGRLLWHRNLAIDFDGTEVYRQRNAWGHACSPLVAGDRVFTITGGTTKGAIAAFDKHTGRLVWKGHDDPPSYSSPIAVTIDGVPQIVFFTGRGLVGLSPEDGAALWRFPWETNDNCNIATPIAAGHYLFISSGYDRGCALLEISRDGAGWTAGLVYSHRRMRNHFGTSVLYQEHLYGFDNAVLTCMEFRTGRVRWKQQGFGKGALLVADQHLIVLGENGKLVLAEACPDEYRQKASVTVSRSRCWTLPALAGGRLYVRDQEQLLCLDLRKR